MSDSPLTLGLTQSEAADHEAGHTVVAHLLGQGPQAVLLEDNMNGEHTGQTQSLFAPSGDEVADLRTRLHVAVAGVLSHIKSVAGRHLGEVVAFEGDQPWEAFYVYLVARDAPTPLIALRGVTSGRTSSVAAVAPAELCNDRRDISNLTCGLQGHGLNACDEGVRSLAETAASLDRPEVWSVVEAVSRSLRAAPATQLRRLEKGDLWRLLNKLPEGGFLSVRGASRIPSDTR